MLRRGEYLRDFLQKVHRHGVCLGELLLEHESERFQNLERLALNLCHSKQTRVNCALNVDQE